MEADDMTTPIAAGPLDRNVMRHARNLTERDIALALVLEFAESGLHHFALLGAYDNDAEFVDGLAARLCVAHDKAFHNKLARVVRKLVRYGVFCGQMRGTHKEYMGEPAKQMDYSFASPGKAHLLTHGKTDYIGEPEWEASFLLRRAYPEPDNDA
jgi:hypothetical protein